MELLVIYLAPMRDPRDIHGLSRVIHLINNTVTTNPNTPFASAALELLAAPQAWDTPLDLRYAAARGQSSSMAAHGVLSPRLPPR
jgi:hypothetical protein